MTGAEQLTGGIATLNRNILNALSRRGACNQLIVVSLYEADEARPKCLPSNASFYGCQGSRVRFATRLLRLSLRRPLIIFDHVTLALPVLPLLILGWVRTVIVAHGSESWKKVRYSSRWVFRFARLVLANSDFTRRQMEECGVRGRIKSCPLGLAPEIRLNTNITEPPGGRVYLTAANGSAIQLGCRVLLLVSRLHPSEREKGHDQLLAVGAELLSKFPETQFVFVGPGQDRQRIGDIACREGIGGSVFLPGRVESAKLLEFYHRCYCYVMPSRQEGFGLVHLEAMNFGKACLACRNDGAADVVVDGETGILVENPDDREELLEALCGLLSNPERTAELGRAGFERLHERFTAAQVQDRIRHFLDPLLL